MFTGFIRSIVTNVAAQRKGFLSSNRIKKSVIVGFTCGAAYFSYAFARRTLATTAYSKDLVLKSIPSIERAKTVSFSKNDESNTKPFITLYQYRSCPFCCKVRAFLNYYGLPYNVIEVNPVLRTELKWSEYKKVPIVLSEDVNGKIDQLNDSTMILSALFSHLRRHARAQGNMTDIVENYPIVVTEEGKKRRVEVMNRYSLMFDEQSRADDDTISRERKWRQWVDDVLVHVLSPNVYRTPSESLQTFNWFSEVGEWRAHFSLWQRLLVTYSGAFVMYFIGKSLKRKHNMKDDVRLSLYDVSNVWLKELKRRNTPYMGGDRPNLADISAYAVYSSIEGCEAFSDLRQHTNIDTWYERMKTAVDSHQGSTEFV